VVGQLLKYFVYTLLETLKYFVFKITRLETFKRKAETGQMAIQPFLFPAKGFVFFLWPPRFAL